MRLEFPARAWVVALLMAPEPPRQPGQCHSVVPSKAAMRLYWQRYERGDVTATNLVITLMNWAKQYNLDVEISDAAAEGLDAQETTLA